MCRGLNSPYIGVQDKCPVSIQLHGVIVHHMVDIMWIIITWSTVGWREAELVGGRRLSPVGGAGGYGLLFYYRLDLWPWTRHAHLTVRWGHTLYCYILVVCVVNWKLVCHFLHAFLVDNTTYTCTWLHELCTVLQNWTWFSVHKLLRVSHGCPCTSFYFYAFVDLEP